MYPAPSPLGDPETIAATFVTSLDLVVGRYHYYYRVARESEGVVKDVDGDHAVSERKEQGKEREEEGEGEGEGGEEGEEEEDKGIRMNNLRVRKEGRVNGEEEERIYDEAEKAKLDSVLGVKEEFEEVKKEEEEKEEDEEKERKIRSLNEEEAELSRQLDEKLARRKEKGEEKKRKEQEERRLRKEEKEIEEKIQKRRF